MLNFGRQGFGRDYFWGAGVPEEVADPEYREAMAEMREDMAEWAPEEYLDDIKYGEETTSCFTLKFTFCATNLKQ